VWIITFIKRENVIKNAQAICHLTTDDLLTAKPPTTLQFLLTRRMIFKIIWKGESTGDIYTNEQLEGDQEIDLVAESEHEFGSLGVSYQLLFIWLFT